jgi:hypothetical protein
MSITWYRLGEGLVEHMDRVAVPQNMEGTGLFSQKTPYRVFPAAGGHEDLRRQTLPLLRLRPTFVLRSFEPRTQGRLRTRRALLPRCPPQVPTPSSHRISVRTLLSQKNISQMPPPPLRRESICEYLVAEKTYRAGRPGDICAGVRVLCFSKILPTWLPESC